MFLTNLVGAIIGSIFNTPPNPKVVDPNAVSINPQQASKINQYINMGMSHEGAVDAVMGQGAAQRLADDRIQYDRNI